MNAPDKKRAALEAAAHWIEEQAWSPIAENSEILRVIREALGARPTLEDFEAAARAAGWQFEPYTADIATADYPGYWWRRDDDGPGNDEDETAKRGFACLTADNARIACQQIDGIEPGDATDAPHDAPDAAPSAPQTNEATAALENAEAFILDCPASAHRDALLRDVRGALASSAPQTPDASAPMLAAVREVADFLDDRARMHRAESRAARTWRKDYEAKEAEKFNAQGDKLRAAIRAAEGREG